MAAASQRIDVVIGAKDMYSSRLKQAQSQFNRYGKSVVTMAAKATVAIYSLSKAWGLANEAAKFDQQEQAFTNLAASHGANAQDIISSLKQVSGQTVSTAAAMASAGKAMLLGIPAKRLAGMMEIARASAKITGQTVQEAFNDIAVGIGRQSPMILDNLGITVKLSQAYVEYAGFLGKTVKQLTDAEKKQAFLNAVMKSGKSIVDRVGKSTLTAADAQAIFSAKMQDMKIIAGKVIITVTAGLSGIALAISKIFAQVLKTTATALGKVLQLAGEIPGVGDKFQSAAAAVYRFAGVQGIAAKEADRLKKQSFAVATALWKEKKAVEGLSKARGKITAVVAPMVSKKPEEALEYDTHITAHKDYLNKLKKMDNLALVDRHLTAFEAEQGSLQARHETEIWKTQDKYDRIYQMASENGANLTQLEEIEAAKRNAIARQERDFKLNLTSQTFGNLSSIADSYFKLTGSKNKEAFKTFKAFKIAETTVSTYSSAIKAFEALAPIPLIGPALGTAAASAAIGMGMMQVQQIRAMQPQGQAHDGMPLIPSTGSYMLEKGERVVKKEDNKKLEKALDSNAIGGGLSVTFQINTVDARGFGELIDSQRGKIISMIQSAYTDRGTTGGPLR